MDFPWILSYETRLINGLHGIFAEKFFVALLPLGAFEAAERKAACAAMRKRRSVHRASLTWILIFCNRLPPRPFPSAASSGGQVKAQSAGPASANRTNCASPRVLQIDVKRTLLGATKRYSESVDV